MSNYDRFLSNEEDELENSFTRFLSIIYQLVPYYIQSYYLSLLCLLWAVFTKKKWLVLPFLYLSTIKLTLELTRMDQMFSTAPGNFFDEPAKILNGVIVDPFYIAGMCENLNT